MNTPTVVVRGVGDIGSAVAHALFGQGYSVMIHDGPAPTTTRRGMAFAHAVFDGRTTLDGVDAVCLRDLSRAEDILAAHQTIPVYVGDIGALLAVLHPDFLVDARMPKRLQPEVQRGLASFTIGLGPNFVAGHTADVVVETSWERLGEVLTEGAALPLAGEPRELAGHGRDRYVYAPIGGTFQTKFEIGDAVRAGAPIAEIDHIVLSAPLDGVLRGLTHDDVPVSVMTKVIEIDPRRPAGETREIAERPRRVAEGVLAAIRAKQRV